MPNITPQSPDQSLEQKKYSLEDYKTFYYLLNAKPDTDIQLLNGRKTISLSDIYDLNNRISEKFKIHDITFSVSSINVILEGGKIKDFNSWDEFQKTSWDMINSKTTALKYSCDMTVTIPNYANPQRHTVRVSLGRAIAPKDLMQLYFTSDEVGELMEATADGVCKVDFINQVLGAELMSIVTNWYEGLSNLKAIEGLQKFLIKKKQLLKVVTSHSIPLVFIFILLQYQKTISNIFFENDIVSIHNIQAIISLILAIFVIGLVIGNRLAVGLDRLIDSYKEYSVFSITKGDVKSVEETKNKNETVTSSIIKKTLGIVVSAVGGYFIKNIMDLFFKG